MPHIPYKLVRRKVEYNVQCHCKLDNTEIGCQMTSRLTYAVDKELANLLCKLLIFFRIYSFDVIRFVYLIKNHINPHSCLLLLIVTVYHVLHEVCKEAFTAYTAYDINRFIGKLCNIRYCLVHSVECNICRFVILLVT